MRRSCGAPPKEAPEAAERGIGNGRSPCENMGAMRSAFCRVQWRASGQAPRGEAIVVAAPIERTASDAEIRQPPARARKAGRTERANHVSEHRRNVAWGTRAVGDSQSLRFSKLRVGTPKLERAHRDLSNGTLFAF